MMQHILREPGSWKVDETGLRPDRGIRVEYSDSIFEIRGDQSGNPSGERQRTFCGIPFRFTTEDPSLIMTYDAHIKLTIRSRLKDQYYLGVGTGVLGFLVLMTIAFMVR